MTELESLLVHDNLLNLDIWGDIAVSLISPPDADNIDKPVDIIVPGSQPAAIDSLIPSDKDATINSLLPSWPKSGQFRKLVSLSLQTEYVLC